MGCCIQWVERLRTADMRHHAGVRICARVWKRIVAMLRYMFSWAGRRGRWPGDGGVDMARVCRPSMGGFVCAMSASSLRGKAQRRRALGDEVTWCQVVGGSIRMSGSWGVGSYVFVRGSVAGVCYVTCATLDTLAAVTLANACEGIHICQTSREVCRLLGAGRPCWRGRFLARCHGDWAQRPPSPGGGFRLLSPMHSTFSGQPPRFALERCICFVCDIVVAWLCIRFVGTLVVATFLGASWGVWTTSAFTGGVGRQVSLSWLLRSPETCLATMHVSIWVS